MQLRKAQGGVSIGAYTWENDGDIVDVDEKTGTDLLAIRGHDFEFVPAEPEPEAKPSRRRRAATESAVDSQPAGGDTKPEGADTDGDPDGDEDDESDDADDADNT